MTTQQHPSTPINTKSMISIPTTRTGDPLRQPSTLVRTLLLAEILLMFVAGPALCAWLVDTQVPPFVGSRWLFPALWVWFFLCITLLIADRRFDKRNLWRGSQVTVANLKPIAIRFTILAIGITACVAIFVPDMLLAFPRQAPIVWIIVMIGYPIASVFAQEVIFRAFFVRRYASLFPATWAMILINALIFGWVHIVFLNWLAVAMCAIGGALFCHTYLKTKSLALTSIEHALYGCFVFTIGLGQFFYAGTNA